MRCPIDGSELLMTERSGVEIDYCPKCRGIWLDRGELDKILEMGAGGGARPPSGVSESASRSGPDIPESYEDARRRQRTPDDDYDDRYRDSRDDPRYRKRRKKESFFDKIEDIFDF